MLVCGVVVFESGCSRDTAERSTPPQVIDPATPNAGVIVALRKGTLKNFPSKTIGEAFDGYDRLIEKEWKAYLRSGGMFSIDFTGWLKPEDLNEQDRRNGIVKKGLGVAFIINVNGSYYASAATVIEGREDGGS